jgi:outer membrane protein OmpA-like peptidoglycan-associated protein
MFQSLVERRAALWAILVVFAAPVWAQSIVGGGTLNLTFATQDLKFAIEDIAGKEAGIVVKETPTETRIALSADVLFDFDKADILPKAQAALHQVAVVIREKGMGRPVKIEGHTDSKGSDPYNQRLSMRRADAVRVWLVQKEGFTDVKFLTQGFGATRPVAPNAKPDGLDDPEGRQKNRRVEIVLAH